MDRAIFDLKMSTEATSLYILICSLVEQGVAPLLSHVRARWNGNEEELVKAIEELIRYRVLEERISNTHEEALQLTPRDVWRPR